MAEGIRLHLRLLGGFQAEGNRGGRVPIATGKVQALVAYLALSPGLTHLRDQLATLLWGDLGETQARANLRQALFVLRKAVPSPPILITDGDNVALDPTAVEVDVVLFERCLADGTATALQDAAELYRGDLLAGLAVSEPGFEEWLMRERERLRELAMDALARLLALQRSAGASETAVQTAQRLLAFDPLQESVHRALMRLYADLGRRPAALRQYQVCTGVLQRELDVEPEEATQQLYREILRRRPALVLAPGSARSGGAPRDGIPGRTPLPLVTDTALIGREQEMMLLRQALAQTMAGRGQLVSVLGETGVGKSRLAEEFALEVLQAGGRVLLGRCYEGEQILPFGPWVDMLRTAGAGITEGRDALQGLGAPWRTELTRLLPELRSGRAAPAAPPDHLKLFEAVARFLVHTASGGPMAIILEDVHWADEVSLRLLGFLGRRLDRWPLLLVIAFRSDEMVDAPGLRRMLAGLDRDARVTRIALAPLSYADTSALVRLLGRAGNDEATLARLIEQVWLTSEGNPFVIVESMRAREEGTLDAGTVGLVLPGRVRDLIAARLDRLEGRAADLMAVAAVIGRSFEIGLLRDAAGVREARTIEGLEELIGRQVIRPIGDRFDFVHDRVREVAYARLLPARRKLLHHRIAQAIERLHPAALERHHAALGLHYRESEAWDRAVVHFRHAGMNALARSANREAVTSFEQALLAAGRLPPCPETAALAVDLRLDLHEALRPLGELEKLSSVLSEAEALAGSQNDQGRLGRIWSARTQYFRVAGDPHRAIESGRRALAVAEVTGDVALEVETNYGLGRAYLVGGAYRPAIERFTRNLVLIEGERAPQMPPRLAAAYAVRSRNQLVLGHCHLGELGTAIARADESIRLVGAIEDPKPELAVAAHFALGFAYLASGDIARAIAALEHSCRQSPYEDLPAPLDAPRSCLGRAYALAGRLDEAMPLLEEAAEPAQADLMYQRPRNLTYLGEALLLGDRRADARSTVERALHLCRTHGQRGFEAEALRVLGEIYFQSEPAQAESTYRQALAIATELEMRPLVAQCHAGLARLHRGQPERARRHVRTALAMFREMGMQFWLETLAAENSMPSSRRRPTVTLTGSAPNELKGGRSADRAHAESAEKHEARHIQRKRPRPGRRPPLRRRLGRRRATGVGGQPDRPGGGR